jgi:Tfp pilus assembly protein PilV
MKPCSQRLLNKRSLNVRRSRKSCCRVPRSGLTSIEVFASATILMGLIAVSSVLILRSARISQETRMRMIALQEVANELHANLALEQTDISNQPKSWPPSTVISDFWPKAHLERQFIQDESGEKIQITLFFDGDREVLPIRLVGWRSTCSDVKLESSVTGVRL